MAFALAGHPSNGRIFAKTMSQTTEWRKKKRKNDRAVGWTRLFRSDVEGVRVGDGNSLDGRARTRGLSDVTYASAGALRGILVRQIVVVLAGHGV